MRNRSRMVAALTLVLGFAACTDASDDDASDDSGAEARVIDTRPAAVDSTLPSDSGNIPALEGGQIEPGAAVPPGGGSAPGAGVNPGDSRTPGAMPPGSSGRDGSSPAGGDDLSGRTPAAQQTSTDAILTRAAAAYGAVRTLRADFEQSTENPVLRRTTTSRGTIFQRRPDRFLMRFSEPSGDRIVSDGQYIWVYYPSVDAQQVIRMTAGAGGAGAVDLQSQFLGDPKTRFNATFVGQESVGGRAADVLVLTPRSQGVYRSLKVWIDRGDHLVRRFEITEHNGVIRRFLLRNLTPGADVDDSLFRFTPPEGAHVVARG